MGTGRRGAGGFTLVELLVVVAILGVLSSVATLSIAGFFSTSNSATCAADAKSLSNAEDTVMAATGSYLSQDALKQAGYLREVSTRYDVQLDGTSKYSLVPTATGACSADPGAGVGTTPTTLVDTTAPYVVGITKVGGDPTNADSVAWTVTFSENVTGVDAGDFIAIAGGALAGPAVTSATGGGMTYTVTASTGSGEGTLGLNVTDNDTIVDLAGYRLGGSGAGNGNATGPAYTVDRTAPTVVSINRVSGSPTNAPSLSWTVTFSESVDGVDATDFAPAPNGVDGVPAITGVVGSDTTYTVTASTNSTRGTLGLNLVDDNSIVDIAGNALGGVAPGDGNSVGQVYVIDTFPPTVVSINLAATSPTNAAALSWTVTFSEVVTGVDAADFQSVKTGLGGIPAVTGVTGTGAVYTVTSSTGTGSGTLGVNLVDNDSILDLAANPLGGAGNGNGNFTGALYTIDRALPTVTGVSSPLASGSYTIGRVVPVTVTFSRPVTVTGTPQLGLATTSPVTTQATYTSGSGTTILTFTYTVAAGNASGDLNYAATTSLTLNGGTIQDSVTNNATLTLPLTNAASSLGGAKAIVIDTATPVVTLTAPTNNASTNGKTPTLSGVAGNLAGDSSIVSVTVYSGSGTGGPVVQTIPVTRTTTTWTTTAATLGDGTYTAQATQSDAAGNTGTTTPNVFTVDTVVPTVLNVTSPLANGTYKAGQVVPVTVTFSEPVVVTSTPQMLLSTGSPATTAVNYASGSGSATLTFNYTVVAGNASPDLDYASAGALSGTIKDGAGNGATLTLPAPGTAGSLGANDDIAIDTAIPTVTGVSSPLADGSYRAGQVVPVTVTFSEPVLVTGTPQLTLSTGSPATTVVNYTGGSGTATLTFNYTVVASNASTDLNYAATTSLGLNSGTIRDAATNTATLTLPALAAANSLAGNKAIVIDTATPVVTLTAPVNNAVTNNVTPTLSGVAGNLAGDSPTVVVTIYAGSGTLGAVVQTIPVTRTTTTWSTSAAPLADGTYTAQAVQSDAAANSGSSTANVFTIDTAAPTVVNVSSTLADGSYKAAQVVPVTVTFSKPVTVTGTPQLTLSTGSPATTAVNYTSGTGTATLTFTYTVAAGNTSADLDYASAGTLALNAGTIKDAAGNSATLTLAAPGGVGSLSLNKDIVIDAAPPTVTVNQGAAQADPTNASPINFTVVFSEPVIGFTNTDVTLAGTALGTKVVTVTGSGPTYNVGVTGMTNGTVIASIAAATATDVVGNANTASTSTDNTVTYDTVLPLVTLTAPTNGASLKTNIPTLSGAAGNVTGDSATVVVTIYNGSGIGGTVAQTIPVTRSAAVWTTTLVTALPDGTYTAQAIQSDTAGNSGASSANTFTVDTVAPSVTVNQAAAQLDPTKTSPINFTAVFSEPVIGFANTDVTIAGTAGGIKVVTVTGTGPTYNVAVTGMTSGTVIATIAAGTATDSALNNNTASTSTDNTVTYDIVAPTVTVNQAVGQADPTNTSPINFTAVFSEPVIGFTNTDVTIAGTAGGTKVVTVTGAGPTYNVAVSGMTTGGTVIATITASTATDPAGNNNTVSTSTDNTVTYDVTPPTVSSINRVGANPSNAASVSWTVTFSESVTGVDAADFVLANSGLGGPPAITGVTGSGSVYTVTASTGTGDGTLGLNLVDDDSIVDATGNTLAGAASGNFTGQVFTVDRTQPTVTGVSSTLANGSYKAAQVVPVTVTFSEPVTVTGTPQLTLSTGSPATTAVNYTSGSGTATLTFAYTVVAGNASPNLDYASTSALALNAGTIKDAATNNAVLTLAAPGAAGSLGNAKLIVVDTTKPLPIAIALANGTGALGTVDIGDTVTITYSEPLKVSSLCSTWSGDAAPQSLSDLTVSVTNGNGSNNDSLSITTSPTCTFNLGSIDLGSSAWVTATRTFGATVTKSTVQWNAAAKTLTITLGTASGAGGVGVANSIPIYTPSIAITDPALNAMLATAFSGTSSGF